MTPLSDQTTLPRYRAASHPGFSASLQVIPPQLISRLQLSSPQVRPRLGFTSGHRTPRLQSTPRHCTPPLGFSSVQYRTGLGFTSGHRTSRLHPNTAQYISRHSSASHQDTTLQSSPPLGFSTLRHMTPHLSASTHLLQPHQLVFAPVLASFLSHAMLAAIFKNSLKNVPVNHAIVHYLEGEFKRWLVQKFNRL